MNQPHCLCDCEAIAHLRFRDLDQFFMEPSDYYDAPISKVKVWDNSGLILKKGKHNRSVMVTVQGLDVSHPLSCGHIEHYVCYVCYMNRKISPFIENVTGHTRVPYIARVAYVELCVASHIVNKGRYFSLCIANISYVAPSVATALYIHTYSCLALSNTD
jgi:hypothetical protein